ncbi:hypothetical protein FHN55_02940 [Streptomyces sp. NP160]|uniref:hypothetical protein n=1 Tax=Streptomyces sp. NP160 TaxID=2586637 RepID=UPI0011182E25|nr:hypothetical protein [Streptomyces sp. NP160]TNM69716.1 hypothetical protein FHN55_02940 [Streptomyces sp. NP160]
MITAAVAAGTTGAIIATAAPASAGWRARDSTATAPLTLARISSRLDTRAPGGTTTPRGETYSAAALLALGPGYVDAVNTSTVTAEVTVTVTTGGAANLVVTAKGCDVPWSVTGTCAAGETTVSTAPVLLGSTSTATLEAVLPSGGRRYLKLGTSTSLGAGASVDLRSSAAPVGAPRDRTSG